MDSTAPTSASPRAGGTRRRPRNARRPRRLATVSRLGAGLLGGYALAAFFTTTVALLVRAPREEAAFLGAVPSFLLLVGAIVWAFAARTAARAWLGVGLPALGFAAATVWLLRAAAPLAS